MRMLPYPVLLAGSAALAASLAVAQETYPPPATTDPTTTETPSPTVPRDMGPADTAGQSTDPMTSQQGDVDETDDMAAQRSRQAAAGQSSTPSSAAGSTTAPVVFLVIPVAQQRTADEATRNGCWATIYGRQGYAGDSLTLIGPLDMPKMVGPFGVDWDDKVSSIKTGPRATVTIYDDENYRDRAATIRPGQEVPELSERLGLFEEPESMRISCPATATSG